MTHFQSFVHSPSLHLPDSLAHFSPWLEMYDELGGHHHALAGAWVASLPRFPLLDLEDAEIAEFDAALVQQRLGDAVSNSDGSESWRIGLGMPYRAVGCGGL